METSVSDTPGQSDVRLDIEKPTSDTQANEQVEDDTAGESDVFLAVNETSSHPEAIEEISDDTSGEVDDNRRVETESSSQAEPNKKIDYVLVYEQFKRGEDVDAETKKQEQDQMEIREKFEENLREAGLEVIGRKDTDSPPVSSPLFSYSVCQSRLIFFLFYSAVLPIRR